MSTLVDDAWWMIQCFVDADGHVSFLGRETLQLVVPELGAAPPAAFAT